MTRSGVFPWLSVLSVCGLLSVSTIIKAAEPPATGWPQWRGVNRHAVVDSLPKNFDGDTKLLWKRAMTGPGLGGVAATQRHVIVVDRDFADQRDIFRCLDADSGKQIWELKYVALGNLDYGNSPRAAPLIHQGKVYLAGAFGHFHCVNLADGKIVWKKHLIHEFGAKLPQWGMAASPLIVDGKLIVNPGAKEASLVALDPDTGKELWRSPGNQAAYSSFIVGTFGGARQIVGYDAISLGGWDIKTGKRLWILIPPAEGDFNVPTPIELDGRLLVTTENNGTRLYEFDDQGKIVLQPVAMNEDLAPDSSTPVVIDKRVFGCWGDMFCLDIESGLKTIWSGEDKALDDYVSLIAGKQRILVVGCRGEVILVDARADKYEPISRVSVFGKRSEVLSHPALVGNRLYIRSGSLLCCVQLGAK